MSALEIFTMCRVGADPFGLDIDAIRSVGVFWAVTGLSNEPSRTATLTALRARAGLGITVLDLDYRAQYWPTPEHARHWARPAPPYVSVAVGNLDERDTAVGERKRLAAARAVHEYAEAIVAGRLACSDAMPTAAEVEALLDEEPRGGTHA